MPRLTDSARLRHAAGLVAIGLMTLIALLSLLPPGDLPPVEGSDKLKHFIAYAALGAAMTIWTGPGRTIRALVLTAAYGAGIEIAQMLTPTGREASLLDEGANILGAGLGALSAFIVRR